MQVKKSLLHTFSVSTRVSQLTITHTNNNETHSKNLKHCRRHVFSCWWAFFLSIVTVRTLSDTHLHSPMTSDSRERPQKTVYWSDLNYWMEQMRWYVYGADFITSRLVLKSCWLLCKDVQALIGPINSSRRSFIILWILNAGRVAVHLRAEELASGS